jgi:hypothetical protein
MNERAIRRTTAAAVLLPLLLFAVTASARSVIRCQLTGAVLDACCCPEDSEAPVAPPTTAGAEGCCRSDVISMDRVPSEAVPRADAPAPLVAAAAPVAGSASLAPPARAPLLSPVGGVPAPPLILTKHALLI